MSRLGFQHIAWSKVHPARHRFDLADSAVATPDLEALGLPHRIELPRRSLRDAVPLLERALGERIAAPDARVLVTAGASEANASVYAGLLEPGDEVLVENPGYEPHRALAGLFGLRLSRFPRSRQQGFAGLAEAVASRLGAGTRMVVLSHLHNPSGAALEESDGEALDRLAERHGLWILCDETFRDAAPLPLGTHAGRGPRWVASSSLTKVYGLGGLRIGWVAGCGEALERVAAAQNGLSANPSLPSVALALELAPHLDALRARAQRILGENHAAWNRAAERVAALAPGEFDRGVPPLGTTAWCGFPGERGGEAFAEFASTRFDLAVTPGRFFGEPRGVRIGMGAEARHFTPAVERLERALEAFVSSGKGAVA
jgi:aspartate/methionine/tyrosine aminotransferase